jgi:hypothetical protein
MRSTRLADNYFAHKVLYLWPVHDIKRIWTAKSSTPSTTRTVEYHCTRTARAGRNALTDSTPLIEAQYIIYTRNTIYSWFHAKPLVTWQNDLPPARAAY